MLDPREDAQAYIEKHNISKLFQVTRQLILSFSPHACCSGTYAQYSRRRKVRGRDYKSRRWDATTVRYFSAIASHPGASLNTTTAHHFYHIC